MQAFERLKAGDKKISASNMNRVFGAVENLGNSGFIGGSMTSNGKIATQSKTIGTQGTNIKIFEVQSAATGDGVYNCYEQTLDATEWDDTAGDDKLDDKNTTEVEVLNLYENDCEADYIACLAVKDRVKAWQFTDDEGKTRWVGVPISGGLVRMARTTAAAGSGSTITCNLIGNDGAEITSGLGSGITVNCRICNGSALNAAIPRLADDDYIFVTNIGGVWYCTTIFQTSEECDCYEA